MIIKARAAGLDIGSIVGGLNQPIGPLRSLNLIQKALELAGELKSLGGALLNAYEKGDAEQLALLRQGHEIKLQQKAQEVRFLQWKQAREATESLLRTRATTLERYKYYLRLLGQTADSSAAPDKLSADHRKLTEENFDDVYGALVAEYDKMIGLQKYSALKLAGGDSPNSQAGSASGGLLFLSSSENLELNALLPQASAISSQASQMQTIAASLRLLPDIFADVHFWGLGGHIKVIGGDVLSELVQINATQLQGEAALLQSAAGDDFKSGVLRASRGRLAAAG